MKTLVVLGMLFSVSVFAGTETGNGGNVVVCPGKPTVVLDYYHATLKPIGGSAPKLVDLESLTADDVIRIFRERLVDRPYGEEFERALKQVGPVSGWLEADLKYMDDSNKPYNLPTGCQLRTAAFRQSDGTMFGDPSIIEMLSPAQQGVLLVHEAIYLLAYEKGQRTSERVRTLIRALLKAVIDSAEVTEAIKALGGDSALMTVGISRLRVGDVFVDIEDSKETLKVLEIDREKRQLRLTSSRYTYTVNCLEDLMNCKIYEVSGVEYPSRIKENELRFDSDGKKLNCKQRSRSNSPSGSYEYWEHFTYRKRN